MMKTQQRDRDRDRENVCVWKLDKSQAALTMLSCSMKFCGSFMMKAGGRQEAEVYTVHPQLYIMSFCMSV